METDFTEKQNQNHTSPQFLNDLEEQEYREYLTQLGLMEEAHLKLRDECPLFPIDDYHIIYLPERYGGFLELDIEYFTFLPGIFGITLDDLTEILSKDKPNYLSVGQSEFGLIKAFGNALENLPHGLEGVSSIFVIIYSDRGFVDGINSESSLRAKDFKCLNNLIRSLAPDAYVLIGFCPHGPKTGKKSKFQVDILTHY